MKKYFYILFLILSFYIGKTQKLTLRTNWTILQQNVIETNGRVNLDSALSSGSHHYFDGFQQKKGLKIDYPGVALEFRCANNWFFASELKFTINKFVTTSTIDYVERLSPTYNLQRYQMSFEAGHYFRKSKLFKPFLSLGFSFTKLYARFDENNFAQATNYLEYVNSTPVFLSSYGKLGLKYGPFGFGVSSSASFTPVSNDGKLKSYKNFTLLYLIIDIARSGVIKKTQYKSNLETDDLKIVRSQVLKQYEASWNLGIPYYRLVNIPYVDAWQDGPTNNRIVATVPPRASFLPYINFNTINSINTKRTLYFQSNVGFSRMKYIYENAKTTSFGSTTPVIPGDDPLLEVVSDIEAKYNNFWMGIGNGFKIKTTRRSFIFGDYDVRLNYFGRPGKDKDTEWEIPPVKKMFLSASLEGGLKVKHWGIALSLERNISKLDKNGIYDHWFNLSLKLIYDVSSR